MDSMNIFSFNVDSKEASLLELKTKIQEAEPLLVLLQDLPSRSPTRLNELYKTIAPNYKIIPSDAISTKTNQDTGIKFDNIILVHPEVIIVKQLIQPAQTAKHSSNGAQALGLDFKLSAESSIRRVFSLYIRPRACFLETRDTLEWINKESKKCQDRLIIMGDVNADAHEWTPATHMLLNCIKKGHSNCNVYDYKGMKINRGITITNFMRYNKLNCLNRPELGPTHIMRRGYANSSAYIDVALVGSKSARIWREFKLITLEHAEHKVVQISREYKTSEASEMLRRRSIENQEKFRLAFHKINNDMFTEFKARVKSWKLHQPRSRYDERVTRMDKLADEITWTLLVVQDNIKTRQNPTKRKCQQRGVFTQLRLKMMRKIKALKKRQRGLPKYCKLYKHHNRLQRNIRHKLYNDLIKSRRLQDDVPKPDIINDTWSCVNEIADAGDYLKTRKSVINTSNSAPIESKEQLQVICAQKFIHKPRVSERKIQKDINNGENVSCIVRIEEVDKAIKRLKLKNYSGVDGINMKTLTRSYEYIRQEVYQLCNMSFKLAKLPRNCQVSLGKLIPKKEAGKYRIVHLSTAVSALLEQIAMRKLEYRLENLNLLSSDQYGFTANVSRHDLVTRILSCAHWRLKNLRQRVSTVVVSLDIEGAFDNVDQDKLIEKMMRDMPDDNIKYWIANFMLDKKIILRDGHFHSQPRQICTGVPQGSSLGPILWNYMINDIGKKSKESNNLNIELLAYADDLYILCKGSKTNEIQLFLDEITRYLADINLRVNPQKSKQIEFHNNSNKMLKIGGSSIESVEYMNILGVQVHRRLKLDRPRFDDSKIARNMRQLYFLNRLKLVRFNFQWDAMIDGLIKSITTVNYFPILALDSKSQVWIDQLIDRVLRNIFRWPKNVSIKLVRLITGIARTEIEVRHQVNMRLLKARDNIGYKHLASIMGQTELPEDDQVLKKLEEMAIRRRYHNPTISLFFRDHEKFEDFEGPSWVAIETKKGTLMIKQMFGKILTIKCGIHSDYPVSYFNTMAMIWHLIETEGKKPKVLTFGQSDPLLAAMTNWNNHDWRSIETKELLINKQWMILRLPNTRLNQLKEKLLSQIKPPPVPVMELSEPDVSDYRLRRIFNEQFKDAKEADAANSHTTVTRGICENPKAWQNLNRSSVSSVAMLALTGVVASRENTLFHAKLKPGEMPYGCSAETCSPSDVASHTTIHRVRDCPRFKRNREEMFKADSMEDEPERRDIEAVLKHRTSSGKFLRLVGQCAFDKDRFQNC